ncbi:hypothetical protein [Paramuribaculum intestinale]|nr:hypothetical protein [Paramuribaculum intestinale]
MVSDHPRLVHCRMGCRHRLRSIRLLFCDRAAAIGAAERAGRQYPRFGAA